MGQLMEKQRLARQAALVIINTNAHPNGIRIIPGMIVTASLSSLCPRVQVKQLECGCPDSTCADGKSCSHPMRRLSVTSKSNNNHNNNTSRPTTTTDPTAHSSSSSCEQFDNNNNNCFHVRTLYHNNNNNIIMGGTTQQQQQQPSDKRTENNNNQVSSTTPNVLIGPRVGY